MWRLSNKNAMQKSWIRLVLLIELVSSNTIFTATQQYHPHRQHKECENCTYETTASTTGNRSIAVFHQFEVSPKRPVYVLFPLPTQYNNLLNPFQIILNKVEPVVDIALDDVYERGLLEPGSIKTIFDDSKMSDAHGPNLAIRQLVSNKLDCIIGYSFIYALAIIARMVPFWADADSNGIPIITTVGLASNLDNKNEYKLMTRMTGPYKLIIGFFQRLFIQQKWRHTFYFYHNDRGPNSPHSECFMLMTSLNAGLSQMFRSNQYEARHIEFNEMRETREQYKDKLRSASFKSNGRTFR